MYKKIKINKDNIEVTLIQNGKEYKGKAKLHPEDSDFGNDLTGIHIATTRAKIKRHEKKVKEYQNKIDSLMKEIKILEDAKNFHAEEKEAREAFLDFYLSKKEAFYKQVREIRKNPRTLDEITTAIEKAVVKLAEVRKDGETE